MHDVLSYTAVSVGIKLTLSSTNSLADESKSFYETMLIKFSLGTLLQEFELEVGQGFKARRI
jgi:hypothetical protein